MALNSKFAKLFNDLITRLETEVTALKHIDLDWNQLDIVNPPIQYPCVLIDFPDTAYQQMQGFQQGDVTVRLKIIYRSLTATTNFTPDVNRETGLQFFELEQEIYEALQAWGGGAGITLVNDMIRQNAATEKRDDGLRVRVMEFRCSYVDDTVTG